MVRIKQRNRLILGAIFITSIWWTGCKKAVLKADPDFEGIWESKTIGSGCDSYKITIKADNTGKYEEAGPNTDYATFEGKMKVKSDRLHVGKNKQFPIGTYPTFEPDTLYVVTPCDTSSYPYEWKMVVNNITFYKFN